MSSFSSQSAKPTMSRWLPGDLTPKERVARMIRVNHAGEYGAKRIYQGQLAVLKGTESEPVLQHMAEQEQEHLDYFEKQIVERHVRPTALFPLWHVAGFMLGAGTALLGKEAAMACTVAVEEVIDEHYQQQLEELDDESEADLKQSIERFRQEELEHRDTALEHEAEQAPAYELLSAAVKTGSRLAIWLASRI